MKTYDDQLFEDFNASRQKPEEPKQRAAKRAYRIARKYPPAVLKVISWAHDAKSVGSTLSYISREGDLKLEDPQGDKLDADQVKERLGEWALDFDTWKKRSRESMHMTFSSPRHSDPEAVEEAVRQFSRDILGNHDYLFVRHDDTDNPHVHLVVKARGWDLSKLNPGKRDLHEWREHYAHCLRDQGIEVEASSRLMRGLFGSSPRSHKRVHDLVPPEDDQQTIPLHQLSDSQKRALRRSEAYQKAFEAIGAELVEKGTELDNNGLKGMGKAILDYAQDRDRTQYEDVQRLHFAKRRIGRAIHQHNKEQESGL